MISSSGHARSQATIALDAGTDENETSLADAGGGCSGDHESVPANRAASTLLRDPCARVLLPSLESELADRAVLLLASSDSFSASNEQMQETHGSSRERRPFTDVTSLRRRLQPVANTSSSSLHLPLPHRPPPRSYPEICSFCQNLSFFSAIYASKEAAGESELQRTRATNPSAPFLYSARSIHLCCTHCLARFVRLDQREQSLVAAASKKRKRDSFSPPRHVTFASAGRLPTTEEMERAFMRTFRHALQRHAPWWRRAFIGVRITEEQIKSGVEVTRGAHKEQKEEEKMSDAEGGADNTHAG